jgi:hypothetical protein
MLKLFCETVCTLTSARLCLTATAVVDNGANPKPAIKKTKSPNSKKPNLPGFFCVDGNKENAIQ